MKKLLLIPLFAMAAIVACNKDDEATPQVAQEDSPIVLKSANVSTGDICVSVKVNTLGYEHDSCFSIGVPFGSASVVKDKVVVKVGEGENVHDSVVFIYQPTTNTSRDYIPCDTCK